MDKSKIAEWLLSLVMEPAQAALVNQYDERADPTRDRGQEARKSDPKGATLYRCAQRF
jgi:hypothetical protein